ncbi:MAG: hypothetical protein ACRDPG_05955 [Nocardioidaceae bacterium]
MAPPPSGTAWPAQGAEVIGGHVGRTGIRAPVLLGIAAVIALAYAIWAFTARRGIFQDFADGRAVSDSRARSSDNLDTVFVIVAAVVVLAALAFWLARRLVGQTSGDGLDLCGLAAAGVGVVVVLIGLFVLHQVSGADGQLAQGQKGAAGTTVVGAGFLVLAVGLVLGALASRATDDDPAPTPPASRYR